MPTAPQEERCAQCAAPLNADQRYCLNCGAPRTYLATAPLGAAAGASATSAPPIPGRSGAAQGGPTIGLVHVLLGVLVLLAAMGVGVLIGASIRPAAKTPAPVVIPVQSSTGTAATSGTGAGTTPSTSSPSASSGSAGAATHSGKSASSGGSGAIKAAIPKGTGNSLSHPAPLSAIEKARKNSGEKGSKAYNEVPEVIETGK